MTKSNTYNNETLNFASDTLDKLMRFLKKRLSTYLMGLGSLFMLSGVPGFWDFILVLFDKNNGLNSSAPEFQWSPLVSIGIVIFLTGFFIRFALEIFDRLSSRAKDLKQKKLDFRKNYKNLDCSDKEEKFNDLWKINTSCHVIDNIFDRGHDIKTVIKTFTLGFPHLKPTIEWFIYEPTFLSIKTRKHLGFMFVLFMWVLILVTALLFVIELILPGSTNTGLPDDYGYIGYAILFIAELLGVSAMYHDIQSLGHAITLVEKYDPKKDIFKSKVKEMAS